MYIGFLYKLKNLLNTQFREWFFKEIYLGIKTASILTYISKIAKKTSAKVAEFFSKYARHVVFKIVPEWNHLTVILKAIIYFVIR